MKCSTTSKMTQSGFQVVKSEFKRYPTRVTGEEITMGRWKKWLIAFVALIAALVIAYVVLNFVFVNFFVDLYWYGALGYTGVLLLKLTYKYLIFVGATLFFFLVIFLNFWVASRYLGCTLAGECKPEATKTGKLIQAFRSGSLKVYAPLSVILAIPSPPPPLPPLPPAS